MERKEPIIIHSHILSGIPQGSQLSSATLTKEAYAIYMQVKKLSLYLVDASILCKSDHLPVKRFLQKTALKLNN